MKNIHHVFSSLNIQYKSHYWTNKRILKTLNQLYDEKGIFPKKDIKKFCKNRECCGVKLIKDRFGSLDNAARLANIKFCRADMSGNGKGVFTRIGKNEDSILSAIENDKGVHIQRQYYVAGKFVDGYDVKNNIVYEIDERDHKYKTFHDVKREMLIRKALNCDVIRIRDGW